MSTTIDVYPTIPDLPSIEATRARTEQLYQELLNRHGIETQVTVEALVYKGAPDYGVRPIAEGETWKIGMGCQFDYYLNGEYDSTSWPMCYTLDPDSYIDEETLEEFPNGRIGQYWVAAELAHRMSEDELQRLENIKYHFGDYRNMGGPAVSSTGYGFTAVAFAEMTKGRIASWDCAFDDEMHQGDTAIEFVGWWGDRQIAFYGRERFEQAQPLGAS